MIEAVEQALRQNERQKDQERLEKLPSTAWGMVQWALAIALAPLVSAWRRLRHWTRMLFVKVIRCGPVPRHVAFIMDGNRRYAQKSHIPRAEGHRRGFDKLMEVLQWCLDIGVKEVTLYAFSIENFKRSADEVGALMSLAVTKILQALKHGFAVPHHRQRTSCCRSTNTSKHHFAARQQKLVPAAPRAHPLCWRPFPAATGRAQGRGVCSQNLLRVCSPLKHHHHQSRGNTSLFTPHREEQDAQVNATLNLCVSYTSRNEMTDAIQRIVAAVKRGDLEPSDVDETLLEQSLFVGDNPDMLVRTSGEYRFSDFLLWQTSYSLFMATERLWPALKFVDLFFSMLVYQRDAERVRQSHREFVRAQPLSQRARLFLDKLHHERLQQQIALGNPDDQPEHSDTAQDRQAAAEAPEE